ncbi:MAG: aryl-sulfate sulfotransferase N-terminal domain-containing protein [Lachnospiraceae bacterium]|nr:aryl-sulfate sulfotransferase N-terminal domain-containing protein [Lachnospiraceae bacterium]
MAKSDNNKKKISLVQIVLVLSIVALAFLVALVLLKKPEGYEDNDTVIPGYKDEYDNEEDNLIQTIWAEVRNGLGAFNSVADIYDVENSKAVKSEIDRLISENEYTDSNPLIIYNPYGTDYLSMYLYFRTSKPSKVEYFIHRVNEQVPDYYSKLPSNTVTGYANVHEYRLIGLIPNYTNVITLRIEDMSGDVVTRRFYYSLPDIISKDEEKIKGLNPTKFVENEDKTVSEVLESEKNVTDGFYVLYDYDVVNNSDKSSLVSTDAIYFYDNGGHLRSKIPQISGNTASIAFSEEGMIYNVSERQIVITDRFGQVKQSYDLDIYSMNGSFLYDRNHNKLIIPVSKDKKDSVNDYIISLDLTSKRISPIIDFEMVFPNYKGICNQAGDKLKWLEINSIISSDPFGSDSVLLAFGEPSTIVKLSDIYKNPQVEYMIGSDAVWGATSDAKNMYYAEGVKSMPVGISSLHFMEYDKIRPTRYYLYFFQNFNSEIKSRPFVEWENAIASEDAALLGKGATEGTVSYYSRYLIDEAEKTAREVDRIPVAYSGVEGSVQWFNGNLIVDSTCKNVFSEMDSEFGRIIEFNLGKYSAKKVEKIDLESFLYN